MSILHGSTFHKSIFFLSENFLVIALKFLICTLVDMNPHPWHSNQTIQLHLLFHLLPSFSTLLQQQFSRLIFQIKNVEVALSNIHSFSPLLSYTKWGSVWFMSLHHFLSFYLSCSCWSQISSVFIDLNAQLYFVCGCGIVDFIFGGKFYWMWSSGLVWIFPSTLHTSLLAPGHCQNFTLFSANGVCHPQGLYIPPSPQLKMSFFDIFPVWYCLSFLDLWFSARHQPWTVFCQFSGSFVSVPPSSLQDL